MAKKGLPYARILMYLYLDDKHPTTADIDKIFPTEILDKITNPGDYIVVLDYMIHGPCGYANPKYPCMVDNKCRKHFPRESPSISLPSSSSLFVSVIYCVNR